MFDEIIFGGGDEVILANEMVKSGYGFYTDYMNHHPHSDLYKETLSYAPHVINRRNHIFQMCLLANTVILPDVPPFFSLEEQSFFEFTSMNDVYSKISLLNPYDDKEYIEYLKPIVVPYIKEKIYIPEFYRGEFSQTEYHNSYYDKLYGIADNYISTLPNRMENALKQFYDNSMKELTILLELSAARECPIMQDKYDFSQIHKYQKYLSTSSLEAYTILKVNCENIIGTLPVLHNINDVIYLKNHNQKDIKRLREVLSEFEFIIRNYGYEKSINKIVKDIQQASKELSKNSYSKKVSKFVQYLSVPISAAEILLSVPPIIGLSIQAVGLLSELSTESKKRKNNWLTIVR